MPESHPVTGLVLSGGGARAAYQVGVLKAIAQIREASGGTRVNPFPVLAGTSAGAINAAALACRADDYDRAVQVLCQVWENFSAEQVYRSDSIGVIRTGARWLTMMSIGWVIARWRRARPRSLLDNRPLEALLKRLVSTERAHRMMEEGHLRALAVTASSYGSGLHVTFYDAVVDIVPWTRSQRLAVRDSIGVAHLLASSAIPFVFPAVALSIDGHPEYCGDGSMRQAAPISPAVHLGADRILVVGAGRMHEPPGERPGSSEYPNIAQIAGHAMSSIFLDALAVDVERLRRINATLALLPPRARAETTLKPIDVLVIAPSERLDDIAAKHLGSLPGPIRALLRGVGVSGEGDDARGAALASYLLFEAPYTRELMALGFDDTMGRRDEVAAFFGWGEGAVAGASVRPLEAESGSALAAAAGTAGAASRSSLAGAAGKGAAAG
jgi:NTE family protein